MEHFQEDMLEMKDISFGEIVELRKILTNPTIGKILIYCGIMNMILFCGMTNLERVF
jgi:hypothetical protein